MNDQKTASGSAPNNNPFAPPRADVIRFDDRPQGLVLASRGQRLGASLLDVVVAFILLGLVAWTTDWNPFRPGNSSLVAAQIRNTILGFGLFLLAHGYLLATRGQTIGKALVKIRIVRSDGSSASFWQLVGMRYGVTSLISAIPFVGGLYGLVDSLAIFRESRLCLHDQIAGTTVILA